VCTVYLHLPHNDLFIVKVKMAVQLHLWTNFASLCCTSSLSLRVTKQLWM